MTGMLKLLDSRGEVYKRPVVWEPCLPSNFFELEFLAQMPALLARDLHGRAEPGAMGGQPLLEAAVWVSTRHAHLAEERLRKLVEADRLIFSFSQQDNKVQLPLPWPLGAKTTQRMPRPSTYCEAKASAK